MEKKSVGFIIFATIFSCGIYGTFWFLFTAKDLNKLEPSRNHLMNFIGALFLGLLTCGIYSIYWMYQFYRKLDRVTGDNNCTCNFVLYLFGLGIVSICIAQSSINNYLGKQGKINY